MSRRKGWLLVGLLVGLLVMGTSAVPIKRTYNKGKAVGFMFEKPENPYRIDIRYRYALHAYAYDSTAPPAVLVQKPTGDDRSGTAVSLPSKVGGIRLSLQGASKLYWSKWLEPPAANPPDPLGPVPFAFSEQAAATAGGASAEANVSFNVPKPVETTVQPDPAVDPVTWVSVPGAVHVWGFAQVTPGSGRRAAQAISAGRLELKAVELQPTANNGVDPVTLAHDRGGILGGETVFSVRPQNQFGFYKEWKDPVSLSVFDHASGTLLAEEALWDETRWTNGWARIDWDETAGLTLEAYDDVGHEAGISMLNLSSWVENPFSGDVQIIDGVFSATGDFAGLNWSVTTVGDVVTAFLPTSELPVLHEFSVAPDVTASGAYDLMLAADSYGIGYAECVPAPLTLALLGMGGLGLRRRR